MKGKIINCYDVTNVQEISVDIGDFNYLVIYGCHINGWFISVTNWNVCTEAGHPSNLGYNVGKLKQVIEQPNVAYELALAINLHWNQLQEKG